MKVKYDLVWLCMCWIAYSKYMCKKGKPLPLSAKGNPLPIYAKKERWNNCRCEYKKKYTQKRQSTMIFWGSNVLLQYEPFCHEKSTKPHACKQVVVVWNKIRRMNGGKRSNFAIDLYLWHGVLSLFFFLYLGSFFLKFFLL